MKSNGAEKHAISHVRTLNSVHPRNKTVYSTVVYSLVIWHIIIGGIIIIKDKINV